MEIIKFRYNRLQFEARFEYHENTEMIQSIKINDKTLEDLEKHPIESDTIILKVYYNFIAAFICEASDDFKNEILHLPKLYRSEFVNLKHNIEGMIENFEFTIFNNQTIRFTPSIKRRFTYGFIKDIFSKIPNYESFMMNLNENYFKKIIKLKNDYSMVKNKSRSSGYTTKIKSTLENNIESSPSFIVEQNSKIINDDETNKTLNDKNKINVKSFQFASNNKTRSGLSNLGNTCYLNSLMQVLKSIKSFESSLNESPISLRLKDLFYGMNSNTQYSPNEFLNYITDIDNYWGDGHPHDCKELLFFIFSQLNKQGVSIYPLFSWDFQRTLRFNCHTSLATENLILITIKDGELAQSIKAAIKEKTMTLSQNYKKICCNQCSSITSCIEYIEISNIPKISVFYKNSNNRSYDTLKNIEIIDTNIGLFKIIGIICLTSYNEYIRHNTALIYEDSEWYLYNDSMVSRYTESIVRGGYLFFYERES